MGLKRVCAIGHYDSGANPANGQTIKTRTVTEELERRLGKADVLRLDTRGGAAALLKAPFQVLWALGRGRNVVLFPGLRGVCVFVPLLAAANLLFKRSVHYVVIGGWLAEVLKRKRMLARQLKGFDGIYVETNTLKNALEQMGFRNAAVMPNCKDLRMLREEELIYPVREPYRLCTFSRIMRMKGIEDAVEAVRAVNARYGRTVYTLDIYGQVDLQETGWFEGLKAVFPNHIRCGGLVPYEKSVEVLKDYFAMLFPTRYATEGLPGTILDAYAAGVPVLSARWDSFSDIVSEGETGFGYESGNSEQLERLLLKIAESPEAVLAMRPNCLAAAGQYRPERAVKVLLDRLDG